MHACMHTYTSFIRKPASPGGSRVKVLTLTLGFRLKPRVKWCGEGVVERCLSGVCASSSFIWHHFMLTPAYRMCARVCTGSNEHEIESESNRFFYVNPNRVLL